MSEKVPDGCAAGNENPSPFQDEKVDWFFNKLKNDLQFYAARRRSSVEKGNETKELAALQLQKYGYGLMNAFNHFCETFDLSDRRKGKDLSKQLVDELVASLDPEWEETTKRRWASKPAGLKIIRESGHPIPGW